MRMATDDSNKSPRPQATGTFPSEKTAPDRANDGADNSVTSTVSASDVSKQARDLTSQVLDFLSNASNETLGACIVALGATTWLILGRVGLVLIGVIGGVVLHATWEGDSQGQAEDETRALEARKRGEKGLDIAGRVLDWRERTKEKSRSNIDTPPSQNVQDFSNFHKQTGAALTNLTDTIIHQYVKWWYGPLLPTDESFPVACRQVLTSFLIAVSSHLSRKRPADTFLDFLTNSSSIVIVFLSELSAALKASTSPGDASSSVHEFLEANPSSSLANVLDVQQQRMKLTAVAEEILRQFLEPKAYAFEPTRTFLREILAGVILEMTVTSCSRPEFLNDWIIYSLEEGNTELLEAFDAGVGGATANGDVKSPGQTVQDGTSSPKVSIEDSSSTAFHPPNEHQRAVSRAGDAMEEAMAEAKRLTELIAAEEAKKGQLYDRSSSSEDSAMAEPTPTSSRDEISDTIQDEVQRLGDSSGVSPQNDSAKSDVTPSFTTFDAIISSQKPTALQSTSSTYVVPPLTLHNASVSIFDDSVPGEKGLLRSKPAAEYLLQIEPATSQYPGWMIARIYSDFETLHEVLRRISVVSGVAAFAEKHQTVPGWKNQSKAQLRNNLQLYLRDALSFQRLAESEGMKRFLEKDQGLGRSSPGTGKGGFGFPSPAAFETMGKGMLDVLASAPKGAAGGGKAILGGVTGVFGSVGSIGQKRQPSKSPAGRATNNSSASFANDTTVPSSNDIRTSTRSSMALSRESQDSPRPSTSTSSHEKPPPLPRRRSQLSLTGEDDTDEHVDNTLTRSLQPPERPTEDHLQSLPPQNELHLPPPPSEMTDDYNQAQAPVNSEPPLDLASSFSHTQDEIIKPTKPTKKEAMPLSSQETTVAVELFFAIINELYTLSSAWTLRLTLLNAAKSYLLRPGNPNLEAIRVFLQSTVIDANTTNTSIASHLQKLRENALPTEDELKSWPPPPTEEEIDRKRKTARKLLVEKGMPRALTSVMGAAASGEALGRIFDCLQVPDVARGLIFALILQAVRAVTQ